MKNSSEPLHILSAYAGYEISVAEIQAAKLRANRLGHQTGQCLQNAGQLSLEISDAPALKLLASPDSENNQVDEDVSDLKLNS